MSSDLSLNGGLTKRVASSRLPGYKVRVPARYYYKVGNGLGCSERAEKPVNEVRDEGSQLLHATDYRIHGSYTATTRGRVRKLACSSIFLNLELLFCETFYCNE